MHVFTSIIHTALAPRLFKVLVLCLVTYGALVCAPYAHALTTNIYPATIDGTDTTTEGLVTEVTSDDSAVDPDTLSAVASGDGTYTVDKGAIMRFATFNTAVIPTGSTITGAVLHLEYGAENGYAPTTAYVRYMASTSALVNTTINPTDITGFSGDQTFNMYAVDPLSVDSKEELAAMDIEFTNADTGGADAIHFDYIYITVTYTPPPFRVSGTLFSDEGITQITTGKTIKVAVGTSSPTVYSTTTDSGAGTWSFNINADNATSSVPAFVIWVDNDSVKATTVMKASSTAGVPLSGIPLYQNRLIITHATSAAAVTINNMAFYDANNSGGFFDADILYDATTSPSNSLTVFASTTLYVKAGRTFAPNGNVTIYGNATSSVLDGSLVLAASSTFQPAGLTTIGGSFRASSTATYSPSAASGLLFTATTTGKVIDWTTTSGTLGSTTFNGINGGWIISQNATTTNLVVANGTLTAPSQLTLRGNYANTGGTFSANNGSMIVPSGQMQYVAGRDTSASSNGTTYNIIYATLLRGDYLYVGQGGSATACSQTVGSASGCELQVYDVSSSTNPVYVAGRDSSGSAAGTGVQTITSLVVSGSYLYVGKNSSDATACSPVAGSASGCEIMIFDISSSTNPVYVAGVDSSGSLTGTGSVSLGNKQALAVYGSYLIVGKNANITACSQLAGSASGCEIMIFDISSSTSPVYVAGRDVSGTESGTSQVYVRSLTVVGDTLYVVYHGDSSSCAATPGSATGCELQVWNISNPRMPTYVTGSDAAGIISGTSLSSYMDVAASGNYLYIGKAPNGTACSQTAGSADGCSLHVYDISSTTNPTFVAGRDARGGSTATDISNYFYTVATFGKYLYGGKQSSDSTACSDVAGSATGCELIVYDISSSSNPTFVAAREMAGNATGTTASEPINAISVSNSAVYVGLQGSTTACAQIAGSAAGCELQIYSRDILSSTLSGTLTGASALGNVAFIGNSTSTFGATNASTTDLSISAPTSVVLPQNLSIAGSFTNSTSTTRMASTTYFTGASSTMMYTISGNLTGSSSLGTTTVSGRYWFNGDASTTDLTITNGGVLNAGGRLSISGNYTNASGTFESFGSSTRFTGTGKTWSGTGTTTFTQTFIDGSITASAPATTSNFTISSGGSFTGSSTLTVTSNFTNSGTWTNASGTLIIAGASSSLPATLTGASALGNTIVRPAGDGVRWATTTASGDNDSWYGLTYGNGLFVAVGFSSDGVITSSDGITWTPRSAAGNDDSWNAVTYGNGLFVAVGNSGDRVMTSPDGITWTARSAAGDDDSWAGVTYGNGLFVAVGRVSGDRVMTSSDGITWTARSAAGGDDNWIGVTYGNGLFVAVADSVGDRVMTSSDGITWTARSAAGNDDSWAEVTYGNGRFVTVGSSGDRVAYSSDGITWATTTAAGDNDTWTSIVYGGGQFVAVSQVGDRVMTSPDGITWTARSAAGDDDSWASVTYGNSLFVVVGYTGDRVMTSSLGTFSFLNNASTTDLTISPNASTTFPSQLTVGGNFTTYGSSTQSSGTTTFSGTGKSMSGTGTTTFANMQVNGTYTSSSLTQASTTNLVIASGAQLTAPTSLLSVSGNYTNSGTFSGNSGTTTFNGTSKSMSGTLTGTSGFSNLNIAGSLTGSNNASTTNLTIQPGGTFTAPTTLSVTGNYANSGTFTAGSGSVVLNGTSQQTATGTMVGSSAFNNLTIANTSGTGSSTKSIVFGARASTTDTLTMIASTSAAFLAGATATSTFQNIVLNGTSASSPVWLRSATEDTQWGLNVPGTRTLAYTRVKDSNACSGGTDIDASSGNNTDDGNNSCWTLTSTPAPTLSSAQNQTFTVGQGLTNISTITITEHATTPTITADNDIRIVIATSSANMRWATGFTMPTYGGTASTKVETAFAVTEGDNSVLVINVTENFLAGDTLTIDDRFLTSFASVTPAVVALSIRTGGASDTDDEDLDDKTVTIKGSVALANHGAGQVTDNFIFPTDTGAELFAFRITPSAEYASTTALTIQLSGVQGVETADLQNAALYRDFNSNQVVDGNDEQVGGSGAVSITNQNGTIAFSTPFLATTTQDYLLVADTANIRPGDMMNLSLSATDLTTMGSTSLVSITPTGSTNNIQHIRSGGGAGPTSIGGDAPAGQGVVTGGDEAGGGGVDEGSASPLNPEPGYNPPSSTGSSYNEWTNGANAYASDNVKATVVDGGRQSYGDFSFNIPSGNIIDGIEVQLEAGRFLGVNSISAGLSWDGDTSLTSTKSTGSLTSQDAVYVLGGPSDTWGRTWTVDELSNTNFRLRLTGSVTSATTLDAIQVKVYHHAAGGGGGGGGIVRAPRLPTYYGYATARGLVAGAFTQQEGLTAIAIEGQLEELVRELRAFLATLSR